MGWKDDMMPATFKGLEFFTESIDLEVGRRTALHEYPQRDSPYVEDIGRKTRRFSFEAFLLGDDVYEQRDRFIDKIEEPGAGLLYHPTIGFLNVFCESCSVTEASNTGRYVKLSLSFIESGEFLWPVMSELIDEAVVDAAYVFEEASLSSFEQKMAGFWASSDNIVKSIEDAKQMLEEITDIVEYYLDSSIAGQIVNASDSLLTSFVDMARSPRRIGESWFNLIHQIGSAAAIKLIAESFIDVITEMFASGDIEDPQHAPKLIEDPRHAQKLFVFTAIVAQGCILASEQDWEVYDDAELASQELTHWLDFSRELSWDRPFLDSLADLRTMVWVTLVDGSFNLPRLSVFTPHTITSSIEIANDLYGDYFVSEEIIKRNNIIHPGFILNQVWVRNE